MKENIEDLLILDDGYNKILKQMLLSDSDLLKMYKMFIQELSAEDRSEIKYAVFGRFDVNLGLNNADCNLDFDGLAEGDLSMSIKQHETGRELSMLISPVSKSEPVPEFNDEGELKDVTLFGEQGGITIITNGGVFSFNFDVVKIAREYKLIKNYSVDLGDKRVKSVYTINDVNIDDFILTDDGLKSSV